MRVFAGNGLLMVIAQARLLPAYRRLSFIRSFLALIFSWTAVTFAGLFWFGVTHPTGWRAESFGVLTLISVFIGAIAARTAIALRQGQLFPTPGPYVNGDSASMMPLASDISGH